MRKSIPLLALLACVCSPAFAQAGTCRAQLQHYDVEKEYAGYRLLFSNNGVEVYSDTRSDGTDSIRYSVSVYGISILVVYQDEVARQAIIKGLREKYKPHFGSAPVDNLKYAFISLKPLPAIPYKPFDERWYVAGLAYREPSACVLDASKEGATIAQTVDQDAWLPVEDQHICSKAVQAVLAWISETESKASEKQKEQCRVALQHYTVSEYGKAFSTVVAGGWVKLPSRLLFSEGGIEVYADTAPDSGLPFLERVSEEGFGVLIVYQDEAARQAMIKGLRRGNALLPAGFGALPDNLKFARIRYMPDSLIVGKPFDEKWHIAHLEYDQPAECQNVFQNDVHPSLGNAYNHTVEAVAYTDENKDVRLEVDSQPLWSKALQAMLAWVKECAERTGR
ncbi:MAG TPA: hypothetical protein VJR23_15495 [Candidatus Acidoferrales bacterium]|nr:hypothetical protein [Candidatus Acidoferrales bacterium]